MDTRTLALLQANNGLDLLRNTDKEIGHVWKLPDVHDNVRFAVTELAEAEAEIIAGEALLRFGMTINSDINAQGKDYARNNVQKATEFAAELADTGMMILKYFMAREKETGISANKLIEDNVNLIIDDDGTVKDIPMLVEAERQANEAGINFTAIAKIGMLLSASMALTAANPGMVYADAALAAALLMVVTHEVFKDKPFRDYLEEKLDRTIRKVMNKGMTIR